MTVVTVVLTKVRRIGACELFDELFGSISELSWDSTGTPSRWHEVLGQSGHNTVP